MSHFCDPTHRIDRDVISPICQRSLLDRFRIDCVYREFTLGDYFQGMLFVSIFIVAFPREAPSHSHRGTIFLPTRDNLADRAPTGRQTDRQKRIRTNARGGTQEDAHGKIAGKFSKREVSALFARTAFSALVRRWAERARGRGGGSEGGSYARVLYVHTCTFCILSGSKSERTLEREPVPERPLVRERSISYLRIKGGRFVQFILNHGTVTGCQ